MTHDVAISGDIRCHRYHRLSRRSRLGFFRSCRSFPRFLRLRHSTTSPTRDSVPGLSVSRRDAAGRRPIVVPISDGECSLSMSCFIASLNSPRRYTLPSSLHLYDRVCAKNDTLHLISRRSRRPVLKEAKIELLSCPRRNGRRCGTRFLSRVMCADRVNTI